MRPCLDMWDHWNAAGELIHPGLQATFEVYSRCWQQLNEIRVAVVDKLRHMIAECEEITEQWYEALPIEIEAVYTNNGDKRVTQVPVLVELLKLAGHQGHSELEKDSQKDLTWLEV